MTWEAFLQFLAFLLFALFSLNWQPKFIYAKYRWIPFLLTCAGVGGAAWTLVS